MVSPGLRKNGLQPPLHTFQVMSWVLFVFFVAMFYAVQFLYTDVVGRAVAGTLYGIFTVVALVAAGVATIRDPADTNIYHPEQQYHPRELVDGHLYCFRCERHVHDTSKHCTICQKCIQGFDHHCIWLNNCVGKHNYRWVQRGLTPVAATPLREQRTAAAYFTWLAAAPLAELPLDIAARSWCCWSAQRACSHCS